jgi:hypothetical protein
MPATSISTGLIGASLTNVFKPVLDGVNAAGNAIYDRQAPFALGTTVHTVPGATGGRNTAVYCKVGATGIAAGATAGITNGSTVAAAAGNTYTNDTGQALVTGDYCFLTAADATTP